MNNLKSELFLVFLSGLILSGCALLPAYECKNLNTYRDKHYCSMIYKGYPLLGTLDWQYAQFRVLKCSSSTHGIKKGIIPTDLLDYGLKKIVGVDENNTSFDRISKASMQGLEELGCIYLNVYEKSKIIAAMIARTEDDVVMFRYSDVNSDDMDYTKGKDIALNGNIKK